MVIAQSRTPGTAMALDNDSETFVVVPDAIDINSGISCTKDRALKETPYE